MGILSINLASEAQRQKLIVAISSLRLIPHLLILLAQRRRNARLRGDLLHWSRNHFGHDGVGILEFLRLMTLYPEFRNLFYHRVGPVGRPFYFLAPPIESLYLPTADIGPGLFIQHGFATIVAAKKIGANCWINQQVTIGFDREKHQPVLEDNVTVNAGAKIIGGVTVGANSTVGANAVVVKNVPPNCTVVGVPARIVRRNGQRVDEKL